MCDKVLPCRVFAFLRESIIAKTDSNVRTYSRKIQVGHKDMEKTGIRVTVSLSDTQKQVK